MKVLILANDAASFIYPMACGLERMLKRLNMGIETELLFDGLKYLNFPESNVKRAINNSAKFISNKLFRTQYRYRPTNLDFTHVERSIRRADVLIVVTNLPGAFLRSAFKGIEKIRREYPQLPIVNYDLHYLATRGYWFKWVKERRGFGLERYDWYLMAEVVSEWAMPDVTQPYSLIGLDVRDHDVLVPKEKPFRVLLDFPREGFEGERELQKDVLNELGIEYTELSGLYAYRDMKLMYSRHAAFFLSFRESFGLPIVENQLCGNLIFTPYSSWAPSFYLKERISEKGEGNLGSNFVVYGNDKIQLRELLQAAMQSYNAFDTCMRFKTEYRHLFEGNLDELKDFIHMIKEKELTGSSHLGYEKLNALVKEEV